MQHVQGSMKGRAPVGGTWEMSLERGVETRLQCVLIIQLRQGEMHILFF